MSTPQAQTPQQRADEEKLMAGLGYCYLKKPVRFALDSMPFGERLSIRRQTQIERDTSFVQKPKGSIPNISMPAWALLSPDQKLSYFPVPGVVLPYARGLLGEQLHRKCEKFHLDDPHNYETGVAFPYDPLHDPYLRRHFEKSRVRKHLQKQGLITKDNFPIENVKLMNTYRAYLARTEYHDNIKAELDDRDTKASQFRNMMNEIKNFLVKTEGRGVIVKDRIDKVRKQKFQEMVRNVKVAEEMKLADEQRLTEIRARKEEEDYKRRLKNFERAQDRDRRLIAQRKKELKDRADLFNKLAVLDGGIEERNKMDREVYQKTFKHYRMEYMDAKWECQQKKNEQLLLRQKLINDECAARAIDWQKNVERKRKEMPFLIARRRAFRQNRKYLRRKYFAKWREYAAKKKELRLSVFQIDGIDFRQDVDKTIEEMCEMFGYEEDQTANFFMNITAMNARLKMLIAAKQEAEQDEDLFGEGGMESSMRMLELKEEEDSDQSPSSDASDQSASSDDSDQSASSDDSDDDSDSGASRTSASSSGSARSSGSSPRTSDSSGDSDFSESSGSSPRTSDSSGDSDSSGSSASGSSEGSGSGSSSSSGEDEGD